MSDRYFVDHPIQGAQARLAGSEAHHLAHVMRAKPGQEVTLFDGTGTQFVARVTRVGRSEIELDVVSSEQVDRELPAELTLAVALPKGDRQRWLVEKATELGVTLLVPLVTAYSEDRLTPSALDKLRRAVIEASKQCGRNRLMQVAEPRALAEVLADCVAGSLHVVADPGGRDCQAALDALLPPAAAIAPVCLAVGPEGGFAADEISLAAEHAWQVVDLGRRILRVETAALALVAQVAARIARQ